MDHYHIWFDLLPGIGDVEFTERLDAYLAPLKSSGDILGYHLTRRKLGFGPPELGEFHLVIDLENLAQLDRAFGRVSERADPVESLHHAVNRWVTNFRGALYRDFPDPGRKRGQEKF